MGNAAITVHHPTSLDHGMPYLESGKILNTTTSSIRLEKKDGAAVGCGGRITFKKNVQESSWTFKITKSTQTDFEVGREMTVIAGSKEEAQDKVGAKFGMSVTETSECLTFIKSEVNDDGRYSELYCYVDYNGKNKGKVEWTQNDLELTETHRWAAASELIVTVKF